ncbi:VWA domain-containing protein [Halosolutus amylolyticus]|uniref:VWA domain-containing protein n=1 Tax=Halosolutus amylolyticus TaxID=2932267 RepID=A0ABD5PPF9_9EURY|nr:vWA domain-containing protein [Halosolutus amylolyticus]
MGRIEIQPSGHDRGFSPQVGLVLLFGMVFVGIALIAITGMVALDSVESQASAEQSEQLMHQFDHDLRTALVDSDSSGSVYLEEDGEYELSNNSTITISVSNGYSEPKTLDDITMGTLRYEDSAGNRFGHQAGGIWREGDSGTTLVSKPDIRYYTETNDDGEPVGRIDLSVTNLQGTTGSGEHTVTNRPVEDSANVSDVIDEVGFVDEIELTVENTRYHDAWYDFLQEEFDAVDCDENPAPDENEVCHDPATESVTVVATIDSDNAFADHVGIDPVVYGGLHTEGVDGDHDVTTNVTAYDRNGDPNISDDLFVVDDDLSLGDDADISGIPVINDELTRVDDDANPIVSQIAYAADLEQGDTPSGYEYINTTEDGETAVYWLSDEEEVLVANMSDPFESVDAIDDELDAAVGDLEYLESNGDAEDVESQSNIDAGLYYGDELTDLDAIDTSGGDVHAGVNGTVELSDLEIDGNDSAYIYANDDVTIDGNVTIEDGDRANALWIYAGSDAKVTIEDEDEVNFDGVIYAPGSELEVGDNVEITGAAIGGETTFDGDVDVQFDRSLRTAVPIPEANREIELVEERSRNALDVTFVLDRSGSMEWNDPHHERVDATTDFIGMLNESDGDRAGVYEFAAPDLLGPTQTLHELSSDLVSVEDNVTANEYGGTNIASGMELALDDYRDKSDEGNDRVMILLSDGKNSHPSYDAKTRNLAKHDANDLDVTIYTIGLGFDDLDEELLEYVADETGGENVNVDNADELDDVFEDIAEDVTADSDVSFDVGSAPDSSNTSSDYVIDIDEQNVVIED